MDQPRCRSLLRWPGTARHPAPVLFAGTSLDNTTATSTCGHSHRSITEVGWVISNTLFDLLPTRPDRETPSKSLPNGRERVLYRGKRDMTCVTTTPLSCRHRSAAFARTSLTLDSRGVPLQGIARRMEVPLRFYCVLPSGVGTTAWRFVVALPLLFRVLLRCGESRRVAADDVLVAVLGALQQLWPGPGRVLAACITSARLLRLVVRSGQSGAGDDSLRVVDVVDAAECCPTTMLIYFRAHRTLPGIFPTIMTSHLSLHDSSALYRWTVFSERDPSPTSTYSRLRYLPRTPTAASRPPWF
uniref:Uncharacterized protein n=1 Tax=Mycena chlorophos TaxID=658473 RepID=A0ABQ0L962_MYCCL|nr:predicted protein [Mycena chlorophos]